jgi:hypothetical protein
MTDFIGLFNIQLLTALPKSLSHTDYCSPSLSSLRCLVAASNSVASWTSMLNGSCPGWLVPFSCHFQLPNWTHRVRVSLRLTVYRQSVRLGDNPLRLKISNFIFQLNTYRYSPYVTSSLRRWWVCRLQLLLALASSVILRSESCGTHDHSFLPQIRDSPQPGGHGSHRKYLSQQFFYCCIT